MSGVALPVLLASEMRGVPGADSTGFVRGPESPHVGPKLLRVKINTSSDPKKGTSNVSILGEHILLRHFRSVMDWKRKQHTNSEGTLA